MSKWLETLLLATQSECMAGVMKERMDISTGWLRTNGPKNGETTEPLRLKLGKLVSMSGLSAACQTLS